MPRGVLIREPGKGKIIGAVDSAETPETMTNSALLPAYSPRGLRGRRCRAIVVHAVGIIREQEISHLSLRHRRLVPERDYPYLYRD